MSLASFSASTEAQVARLVQFLALGAKCFDCFHVGHAERRAGHSRIDLLHILGQLPAKAVLAVRMAVSAEALMIVFFMAVFSRL